MIRKPCSYRDAQGACVEYATSRGRCDEHQREAWVKRPGAYQYGAAHRRDRRNQLRRQPFCEWPGCGERATELDHIVPLAAGGAAHDPANHQSLCTPHHEVKTQMDRVTYGSR